MENLSTIQQDQDTLDERTTPQNQKASLLPQEVGKTTNKDLSEKISGQFSLKQFVGRNMKRANQTGDDD